MTERMVEQAVESLVRDIQNPDGTFREREEAYSNEEREETVTAIYFDSSDLVYGRRLMGEEPRKKAFYAMLPYIPADRFYVIVRTEGKTSRIDSMDQFPEIVRALVQVSQTERDKTVGEALDGKLLELLIDKDLSKYDFQKLRLAGARLVRCQLTDQDSGEAVETILFAHDGLQEILARIKKWYYRELFHRKKWQPVKVKRKYLPYVWCYTMLKMLRLERDELRDARLKLWHLYRAEHERRYGEAYGRRPEGLQKTFKRYLDSKSTRIVEAWEWLPEGQKEDHIRWWADGKFGSFLRFIG